MVSSCLIEGGWSGLSWLGGFGIGAMVVLMLILVSIPLLLIGFWIWMLVDCVQRPFRESGEKLMWVIIIILAHVIGAAIYYIVVKRHNKLSLGGRPSSVARLERRRQGDYAVGKKDRRARRR